MAMFSSFKKLSEKKAFPVYIAKKKRTKFETKNNFKEEF